MAFSPVKASKDITAEYSGYLSTVFSLDDPEYQNQQEYGLIANEVGENPLNGNNILLTGNAEDEEIV